MRVCAATVAGLLRVIFVLSGDTGFRLDLRRVRCCIGYSANVSHGDGAHVVRRLWAGGAGGVSLLMFSYGLVHLCP